MPVVVLCIRISDIAERDLEAVDVPITGVHMGETGIDSPDEQILVGGGVIAGQATVQAALNGERAGAIASAAPELKYPARSPSSWSWRGPHGPGPGSTIPTPHHRPRQSSAVTLNRRTPTDRTLQMPPNAQYWFDEHW